MILALTGTTFPFVLQIADKGFEKALEEGESLRKGLNVLDGKVICQSVAETFGLSCALNPFSPYP